MADPTVLQDRLGQSFGQVPQLLDILRVPSISVGVIHQGEVIFTKSVGLRVVDQAAVDGKGNALSATPETAYLIASCSKIFLACAVGILVEGKMSWDDPSESTFLISMQWVTNVFPKALLSDMRCVTNGFGKAEPAHSRHQRKHAG